MLLIGFIIWLTAGMGSKKPDFANMPFANIISYILGYFVMIFILSFLIDLILRNTWDKRKKGD